MASRKPAPKPSSILRSSVSRAEVQSLADAMLRSSLGSPLVSVHARPAEHRHLAGISRGSLRRRRLDEPPSAAEAELRLVHLRDRIDHARARALARVPSTGGLFRTICSTDLLFLVDTTASVLPYIEAAKRQVISIMDDIRAAFFNEAVVRMAVVGYKDHGDTPHIQYLDFTADPGKVRAFLGTLVASGGGDVPEDVLGGLQQAINASWEQSTRCIVHISDAPAHGCDLHDFDDRSDTFPEPGSEPHRLTHGAVLRQMIGLNISYALLRINHSTDRMAYTFFQAYAALSPHCRLHRLNTYCQHAARILSGSNAGSQRWAVAHRQARSGLQFEEVNLGTSLENLRHLVVKIVTTSAPRAPTLTTSAGGVRGPLRPQKLLPALSMVNELPDQADDSEIVLDTAPAQWDTPGWLNETLECAAYSTDVVAHSSSMLDQMMAADDNIIINTTSWPRPCARSCCTACWSSRPSCWPRRTRRARQS